MATTEDFNMAIDNKVRDWIASVVLPAKEVWVAEVGEPFARGPGAGLARWPRRDSPPIARC